MAIIRKAYGPFKFETWKDHEGWKARWHFIGIRGDYTTAHWSLTFTAQNRKFLANNTRIGEVGGPAMRAVERHLPKKGRAEEAHPKAWLSDDDPVMSGTVTDILRSKLKPEDIARVTAIAIVRK